MHPCTWMARLIVILVGLALTTAIAGAAPLPRRVAQDQPWTARLALDGVNGRVYALAIGGNDVYLGGAFYTAGNTDVGQVVKWDGSNWSTLGDGLDGAVYALAWDDYNKILYAGGTFAGLCADADCSHLSARVNHIAQWNGTAWSAVGNGVSADVYALVLDSNNDLYVGGSFSSTCTTSDCSAGTLANNIALWQRANATWSQLLVAGSNVGVGGTVRALVWDRPHNALYAGGEWITIGSTITNRIAKWEPTTSSWTRLGSGVSGTVRALAWDDANNYLYAGGDFVGTCSNLTCTNSTAVNYIGRWNGSTWSALDGGVGNPVHSLVLDSTHSLYAGGDFASASNVVASRIAKWTLIINTGIWSPLGTGSGERVTALAAKDGTVFAAGYFPSLGGDVVSGVAKWTPSTGSGSWSTLTLNVNSRPSASTPGPASVLPTSTGTEGLGTNSSTPAANTFSMEIFGAVAILLLAGVTGVVLRRFAPSRSAIFVVLTMAVLAGAAIWASPAFDKSPSIAAPETLVQTAMQSPVPSKTPSTTLAVAAAAATPTTVAPSPTSSMTRVVNSPTPTRATPTLVATEVSITATPTVGRTSTITPTIAPTKRPTITPRYPAVILDEPRHEQQVHSETVTFEWQDIGPLPSGEHYELRLKQPESVAWDRSFPVEGGKAALFIQRDNLYYGDYIWSIFIVDAEHQVVSRPGEQRKLSWQSRAAPATQPQPPAPPFVK